MIRAILSHFTSLVMAFVFAVVVWGVATMEENPSREAFYFEALPIELINQPSNLIVYQKTTERVQVKVRAPQASWDQLQPTSFRVVADLNALSAGTHQVPLKIQAIDPRVAVTEVRPPTLGVQLEHFKTRTLDVHSDVLDAAPLGYTFRAPTSNPAQAQVSGPGALVDQVAELAADVYLRGAKSPFDREVPVQARNGQGLIVSGLTISPTIVIVKVQMEQRVGYKDVSLKTVLKGAPAAGYWVSNIVVNPSTATIVGNPDAMAKIPGFIETVPIDVTGATADVNKRATLSLPEGVSVLNNEGVTVQVSVTPLLGGQTVRRKISLQGLKRGQTATVSPESVEVILSGPVPALQSLAPDDVQVIVDVTNLGAGAFQLKPRVPSVPGALRVQNIVPDTIQVSIVDLSTPTPQPSPVSTAVPNPTPTLIPTK